MSSIDTSCHIFINATSIGHEVGVYGETHHHWPISWDFPLDFVYLSHQFHWAHLAGVLLEWLSWVLTLVGAVGSFISIRHASFWNEAIWNQIVKWWCKEATLATAIIKIAINHILRWKINLNSLVWCDAESILEETSRSKSPTASTGPLSSHWVNAIRPLIPGVERHR